MVTALAAGAAAGLGMGYVLQRGQLCFHSMFAFALAGRTLLLRGWLLGVAVASVGLSGFYLTPWSRGLNTGLPFAPVSDIAGGLVIGAGMVVASSCVSGLFYKLGSGMYGTLAGLAGWIGGELAARHVHLPGPTVLGAGQAATFAGVIGVPRLALSVLFLALVAAALWRWRPAEQPAYPWQWKAPQLGVALGLVTIAGWVLAKVGGSGFGPSTVGASASVASGSPDWWLIAFLLAIIAGAAIAARTAGGWQLRGETPVRYGQLAVGGFLLGAGGWIAGGCNLGHGLSGAAQLNVSSWVVVASMAAGVALSAGAVRAVGGWRPARLARASP
ncbi:MAG: YeeE/YedE family protein [Actinomycetota bacterium]|nr:YeeE/YedE family protein [Actinomycetota bacterium]